MTDEKSNLSEADAAQPGLRCPCGTAIVMDRQRQRDGGHGGGPASFVLRTKCPLCMLGGDFPAGDELDGGPRWDEAERAAAKVWSTLETSWIKSAVAAQPPISRLKLFAWQPNGHGELPWFVCAENEAEARAAVEAEIAQRRSLPSGVVGHLTAYEVEAWGSDYYTLTVAEPGQVLCNENQ